MIVYDTDNLSSTISSTLTL